MKGPFPPLPNRPTNRDRPSLLCAVAVATAASRTSKTEPTSFALQLATERGHRRRTSEWREWTDGRDGRARADADGRREERPGEQVMLFRGRTDARRQRERERRGRRPAEARRRPYLYGAENGRRQPPLGGHNGDRLSNEVGRIVHESCTKRRKKGHFMSLVGRPGEKYFSHRSSLYTKLRFSLTFAPSVDRSFAVRPMRLFVGGHLSPVRGGRGRGRRCDGDRRPSSSGESVPRRGRGGGGGGKVEGTRGRGGEIGERPGRAGGR